MVLKKKKKFIFNLELFRLKLGTNCYTSDVFVKTIERKILKYNISMLEGRS